MEKIYVIPVPGDHLSMMDVHVLSLGQAVTQAINQFPPSPLVLPEINYSPLISIHTGQSQQTPIFCIPGAGDNVTGFVSLANSLSSDWPLYGLQPRGVEGELVPYASVEIAAASYIQTINAVQTDGKIHLIGHSFGGWVAYEVATQWHALGRPVASLTLIDSEAPVGDDLANCAYHSLDVFKKLIDTMELAAEKSLDIDPNEFEGQALSIRLQLLHKGMVRVGLIPKRSQPDELLGMVRTFATALRTTYKPKKVYPGTVYLALTQDPRSDKLANQQDHQTIQAGWKQWASSLSIWQSPGNHFSILKFPYVKVLAQWWKESVS